MKDPEKFYYLSKDEEEIVKYVNDKLESNNNLPYSELEKSLNKRFNFNPLNEIINETMKKTVIDQQHLIYAKIEDFIIKSGPTQLQEFYKD